MQVERVEGPQVPQFVRDLPVQFTRREVHVDKIHQPPELSRNPSLEGVVVPQVDLSEVRQISQLPRNSSPEVISCKRKELQAHQIPITCWDFSIKVVTPEVQEPEAAQAEDSSGKGSIEVVVISIKHLQVQDTRVVPIQITSELIVRDIQEPETAQILDPDCASEIVACKGELKEMVQSRDQRRDRAIEIQVCQIQWDDSALQASNSSPQTDRAGTWCVPTGQSRIWELKSLFKCHQGIKITHSQRQGRRA